MTDALPQRVPFPRARAPYKGVPLPVLERYADALRQWADTPRTSRRRGADPSPASGDPHRSPVMDRMTRHRPVRARRS
jgi:hypothetical protein